MTICRVWSTNFELKALGLPTEVIKTLVKLFDANKKLSFLLLSFVCPSNDRKTTLMAPKQSQTTLAPPFLALTKSGMHSS